ncbi:MAG: CapA family protein [Calditrichia bacterium]|nr:CapA family protein [Calditrichota bacterium]MCB0286887.1 CapA family protein [Calditrichota bacterium]MCB9070049.1 CapA family protein [Calditrichia bacterium]
MGANFKIALMGDAMLDRDVQTHFFSNPGDFHFTEINAILADYDLRFLNLENPLAVNGSPHPQQQPRVTFRSHPKTVQILQNLNIDAVTLANNHILDHGPDALAETLEHLDRVNIRHVGAGRDFAEANAPLKIETNGVKLAILGYTYIYSLSSDIAKAGRPGLSDHRIEHILTQIRQLKSDGYIVLVTVHWGIKYGFFPVPYKQRQAREMIDAGASLIVGHGPHYPNGIENYNDGQIIYSLGNFIFDEPYFYANRSFVYGVEIDEYGKILHAEMYPYRISNQVPQMMHGREKQWLENRICILGRLYQQKDAAFWQGVSDRWFRELLYRSRFMRSLKFLKLPPKEFFLKEVSYSNYAKYVLAKVKSHVL